MASTNKTTNLELSQYIGTDKPTYLGDYNSDMLKIDTASGELGTAIQTVAGNVSTTDSKIGTLANLNTTDKTSLVNAVNEVDNNCDSNSTSIGTLSNLNTTNKTTIVNAINEVVGNVQNFNLTTFNSFTENDMTPSQGSIESGSKITVAVNNDGSLAKIYGLLTVASTNIDDTNAYVSIQTSLRPAQDITINSLAVRGVYVSTGFNGIGASDVIIKTTGEVRFVTPLTSVTTRCRLIVSPCLLFVKDFGDAPTPNA